MWTAVPSSAKFGEFSHCLGHFRTLTFAELEVPKKLVDSYDLIIDVLKPI